MRARALLCLAAAAALTGCAAPADTTTNNPTTSNTGTSNSGISSQQPRTYGWGETATTGTVAITLHQPQAFTASNTAMPQRLAGKPAWQLKVTLKNTSSETFNPMSLSYQATINDTVVESVYDSGNLPGSGVMTIGTIPPGATASGWMAFTGELNDTTTVHVTSMLGDVNITVTNTQ